MKRVEVESVDEHPYPSCGEGELPEGEVVASGDLRAGPTMREQSVVERWEVRRRDCLYVFTVHQEWARQVTDVEVVFDEEWTPLRATKEMSIPGAVGHTDSRLYELRNDPPTMTQHTAEGETVHRRFNGAPPIAVIGPGRALVSAWIWKEDQLEVGEIVRGPVLDFREMVERIDEVALRRDPDRDEESLGGDVRVYTVFGRESIFTDDEGVVVGDLAGLRTADSLSD